MNFLLFFSHHWGRYKKKRDWGHTYRAQESGHSFSRCLLQEYRYVCVTLDSGVIGSFTHSSFFSPHVDRMNRDGTKEKWENTRKRKKVHRISGSVKKRELRQVYFFLTYKKVELRYACLCVERKKREKVDVKKNISLFFFL